MWRCKFVTSNVNFAKQWHATVLRCCLTVSTYVGESQRLDLILRTHSNDTIYSNLNGHLGRLFRWTVKEAARPKKRGRKRGCFLYRLLKSIFKCYSLWKPTILYNTMQIKTILGNLNSVHLWLLQIATLRVGIRQSHYRMSLKHNMKSSGIQTHNVGRTSVTVVFQFQLQPTAGRQVHNVRPMMHQQKRINVALQLSALENYQSSEFVGKNVGTVLKQLLLKRVSWYIWLYIYILTLIMQVWAVTLKRKALLCMHHGTKATSYINPHT